MLRMKKGNLSQRTSDVLSSFLNAYKPIDGHKDYAVFDCDGTLLYGDTAVTVFEDQIEWLNYAFSPKEMEDIFRTENEANWKREIHGISFPMLLKPLIDDYTYLYNKGFVSRDLSNRKRSDLWEKDPIFLDFRVRMNRIMVAVYLFYGYGACAYAAYSLFAGFTEDQYYEICLLSHEKHSKIPGIQNTKIVSPLSQEEAVIESGLHPITEMRDLLYELRNAGIDLYVVSASPGKTVKEALIRYEFPEEIKILSIGNKLDEKGEITPKKDVINKPYAIKTGKALTIKDYISPKYGGKGPILVAGDSEGDVAMLTAFKDTKISLLLDGGKNKETDLVKAIAIHQMRNHIFEKSETIFLLEEKDTPHAKLTKKETPTETSPELSDAINDLNNGLSYNSLMDRLHNNDNLGDYDRYPGYHRF